MFKIIAIYLVVIAVYILLVAFTFEYLTRKWHFTQKRNN